MPSSSRREESVSGVGQADPTQGHSGSVSSANALREGDPAANHAREPEGQASTGKPLVFISASHKDAAWRDRLKASLDNHREFIEWWDDSRIEPGLNWRQPIEAAIRRASVAVALLSPDYLGSETARAELEHLAQRAKRGELRLLPVVLRDCDWQRIEAAAHFQIWNMAKPVSRLRGASIANELEKIAQAVVDLTQRGDAPSNRKRTAPKDVKDADAPAFRFSKGAMTVLQRARSLTESSHRSGMTSDSILFAFMDVVSPLAHLVQQIFSTRAQYSDVFGAFMVQQDSGNERHETVHDLGNGIGKVSTSAKLVLETAREIVQRVSKGETEVHQPHLFAALLVAKGDQEPDARGRLHALEIDIAHLKADFRTFLQTSMITDDLNEWDRVLAAEGPQRPTVEHDDNGSPVGPPGYTSEYCGVGGGQPVKDYLGVEGLAHRLGDLIALKETKLPLAVGLFGNWGSGKSHFMNLIDRRLRSFAPKDGEEQTEEQSVWCRQIVPVYFNAWHYLDANLWASLVSQIFESLFAHLRPRANALETVQKQLEKASVATARVAEELTVAQATTKAAKKELETAEAVRERQQNVVNGLVQGWRDLVPADYIVKQLGIEKEVKTVGELRSVVQEARTLAGRARTFLTTMWKAPGRGLRIGWLIVAVVVVPGIAFAAVNYLPGIRDWPSVKQLLGFFAGLGALVNWARPLLKEARTRLNNAEELATQAEAARARFLETPEVKRAQEGVRAAAANEKAAQDKLAEAQAREQQLKEEAANLAPERQLGRFIELKAQSAEYRGQLGLVSLARRDFQELSNLFADADAFEAKLEALDKLKKAKAAEAEEAAKFARAAEASKTASAVEAAKATDAKKTAEASKAAAAAEVAKATETEKTAEVVEVEKEMKKLEELSNCIDRIVLFVDDLDRCQPEKVVEILQAVHLLLAFPLFAVVVGVDQRCLRQSLRLQFKGLVHQSEEGATKGKNGKQGTPDDEQIATPLDYLEKIFHVPFQLPAMDETGFKNLIQRLTEPLPKDVTIEVKPGPGSPVSQNGVSSDSVVPPAKEPGADASSKPPASAELAGNPPVAQQSGTPAPDPGGTPTATPVVVRVVGSVPLLEWERNALAEYHELIRTPRGATRLLNTYRLVRAGVPTAEWGAFCGTKGNGECRIAMLMLALAAGHPGAARAWFDNLRSPATTSLIDEKYAFADRAAWERFKKVHGDTFKQSGVQMTGELVKGWLDRVERFAF